MRKLLIFSMLALLATTATRAATTVEKTIQEIAQANSWTYATQYTSFSLDANITITCDGGSSTGKYYDTNSNYEWRLYQSENASVTITAGNNCTMSSVTIL